MNKTLETSFKYFTDFHAGPVPGHPLFPRRKPKLADRVGAAEQPRRPRRLIPRRPTLIGPENTGRDRRVPELEKGDPRWVGRCRAHARGPGGAGPAAL